jgi:hypothetical protein
MYCLLPCTAQALITANCCCSTECYPKSIADSNRWQEQLVCRCSRCRRVAIACAAISSAAEPAVYLTPVALTNFDGYTSLPKGTGGQRQSAQTKGAQLAISACNRATWRMRRRAELSTQAAAALHVHACFRTTVPQQHLASAAQAQCLSPCDSQCMTYPKEVLVCAWVCAVGV